MENNLKGKFIVFEGLDGSGQSTQVKLLADYLRQQGEVVLATKEPTKDSPFAVEIRQVLSENKKVFPKHLQGLFAQDRKWHIKEVVKPALDRGEVIICDRYVFSSFAFGEASGVSREDIAMMNEGFLEPDIIFFLDVKPRVCLARIDSRGGGRKLFEKLEKLERTYQKFKELFEKKEYFGHLNIKGVNGEQDIQYVFKKITKYVNKV